MPISMEQQVNVLAENLADHERKFKAFDSSLSLLVSQLRITIADLEWDRARLEGLAAMSAETLARATSGLLGQSTPETAPETKPETKSETNPETAPETHLTTLPDTVDMPETERVDLSPLPSAATLFAISAAAREGTSVDALYLASAGIDAPTAQIEASPRVDTIDEIAQLDEMAQLDEIAQFDEISQVDEIAQQNSTRDAVEITEDIQPPPPARSLAEHNFSAVAFTAVDWACIKATDEPATNEQATEASAGANPGPVALVAAIATLTSAVEQQAPILVAVASNQSDNVFPISALDRPLSTAQPSKIDTTSVDAVVVPLKSRKTRMAPTALRAAAVAAALFVFTTGSVYYGDPLGSDIGQRLSRLGSCNIDAIASDLDCAALAWLSL